MRAQRPTVRPGHVLAVSLVLPALAAFLGGLVHVSRCVPVAGGVAQLGVHLALLRPASECPTGTLALGGEQEQVLAVALVLTAPALLAHVVVLLGALGAGTAVRRVLSRLAGLAPWGRVPGAAPRLVVPRLHTNAVVRRVVRGLAPVRTQRLRGPPMLAPA
ncbi:hypothetical protein [Georgenia wangjunii]|uniref:hypothetical protein n=1 Tax=Georgenia wangjunii TaxID=3117730 RepID=UPI002F26B16C